MQDKFKIWRQYLVPQHAYTRLMGRLAECRWPWLKNWMINTFIRRYKVNMQEAVIENPADFPTFNQFFTRHLKPELRPIISGANQIACPVDGYTSQLGQIKRESLFQAKGHDYDLTSLLGGDKTLAEPFINGQFATLYLAPSNYHRIHMPISGSLRETIYVPGTLFSVNQLTAATVPNLFTRNERLVCLFDSEAGPMAIILVGAMIVGKIRTIWDTSPASKVLTRKTIRNVHLEKGEELGHFELGSTVIMLFGENKVSWKPDLHEEQAVKMGELFGTL